MTRDLRLAEHLVLQSLAEERPSRPLPASRSLLPDRHIPLFMHHEHSRIMNTSPVVLQKDAVFFFSSPSRATLDRRIGIWTTASASPLRASRNCSLPHAPTGSEKSSPFKYKNQGEGACNVGLNPSRSSPSRSAIRRANDSSSPVPSLREIITPANGVQGKRQSRPIRSYPGHQKEECHRQN